MAGVQIGSSWGPVWDAGVWAVGLWRGGIVGPIETSETVFPISITVNIGWLPTGGAVVDVIRDSNDGTFISTPDVNSQIQCDLDSSTIISVSSVVVNIRARKT